MIIPVSQWPHKIEDLPGSDEDLARRGAEDPSRRPGFCHDAE
jgi:hypothetical protein